jgi:hypothetical protein
MKSLNELQAKDFAKWLRKQQRTFGRNVQVGSIQDCPVEVWAEEVTGIAINFICGGEIEIEGKEMQYTDWSATCYYMMDEEGMMVVEAAAMLNVINLDRPEAYLIAR